MMLNQELSPDDLSDAGVFWEDLGTFVLTIRLYVEYLTDRLKEDAIRVLERHHSRPFVLCLTHHAVHDSIRTPPVRRGSFPRQDAF